LHCHTLKYRPVPWSGGRKGRALDNSASRQGHCDSFAVSSDGSQGQLSWLEALWLASLAMNRKAELRAVALAP
jgi:hypothetical protein